MKTETSPFDAADYLTDDETIAEYLSISLESGDPRQIALALSTVVRARGGVAKVASESGLDSETLSEMTKDGDHSSFGAMLKVMHSFGIKLSAASVA